MCHQGLFFFFCPERVLMRAFKYDSFPLVTPKCFQMYRDGTWLSECKRHGDELPRKLLFHVKCRRGDDEKLSRFIFTLSATVCVILF